MLRLLFGCINACYVGQLAKVGLRKKLWQKLSPLRLGYLAWNKKELAAWLGHVGLKVRCAQNRYNFHRGIMASPTGSREYISSFVPHARPLRWTCYRLFAEVSCRRAVPCIYIGMVRCWPGDPNTKHDDDLRVFSAPHSHSWKLNAMNTPWFVNSKALYIIALSWLERRYYFIVH